MRFLSKHFGHIFKFNEDKDAIGMATDIDTIAGILRDAQTRDAATTTNDDGETLYTPYMNKLVDQALEQATDIGLSSLGLYQLRNDMLRAVIRMDDTLAATGLELHAQAEKLNASITLRIITAQDSVKVAIDTLNQSRDAALAIVPALAELAAEDNIWNSDDVTKDRSPADVLDAMNTLRDMLDAGIGKLNAAALTHLRTQHATSMQVIAPAAPKADDTKPAGPRA